MKLPTYAYLGSGKEIHVLEGTRTLCGLQRLFSANIRATPLPASCLECRRELARREAANGLVLGA
jgi:hypothetical protein